MIPRHITSLLRESLSQFPVVLLVGARQVGKSTLVQSISGKKWSGRYLTLDDRTVLDAALTNPDGFIQEVGWPVILDEVQRAPDLLRAIKLVVDRNRQPGMFLLTGSANVLTLSKVSETLAGRVAVHELYPFSWSEIQQRRSPVTIEHLFTAETVSELIRRLPKTFPPDRIKEIQTDVPPIKISTSLNRRLKGCRRYWRSMWINIYGRNKPQISKVSPSLIMIRLFIFSSVSSFLISSTNGGLK